MQRQDEQSKRAQRREAGAAAAPAQEETKEIKCKLGKHSSPRHRTLTICGVQRQDGESKAKRKQAELAAAAALAGASFSISWPRLRDMGLVDLTRSGADSEAGRGEQGDAAQGG